ncbi:YncE family protein [Novosphingobium lentum]|uniref:YncE family protein n=1 Tax=Novosphingobium lentum TaxID=145287 RepID=UPI0012ECC9AE|nr:gluconolactonase [Novosphingobium lentum]
MAVAAPAPPAMTYRAEASIPLPDGRWDLLSVDADHRRVVIARGDSVSVVDIATGTARSIGAIDRGHAALAVPGTHTIAVTSGKDNTLRLLNADDGHEIAKIPVGDDPDAAIWDPAARRIVVMNAKGGTVSVVDPVAIRVETSIAVKPALELAVMIAPGLMAINDEDANEIELVDLTRGVALAPIALNGCEGPTGIAFAPDANLLLSACANGKAALVDVRTRKLVKLLPIGAGPDTALYDAARRRFLVPCGKSATLSVFALNRHGAITPLAPVPTEIGARTGAIGPDGRIYLPTARFLPAEAGKRPDMVPGSAHLIVLVPTG